jgi:hypothetical protein
MQIGVLHRFGIAIAIGIGIDNRDRNRLLFSIIEIRKPIPIAIPIAIPTNLGLRMIWQ